MRGVGRSGKQLAFQLHRLDTRDISSPLTGRKSPSLLLFCLCVSCLPRRLRIHFFPAGELASFLGLRTGSRLAPSPAEVSPFPCSSSRFCTKRTLQKENAQLKFSSRRIYKGYKEANAFFQHHRAIPPIRMISRTSHD
ncbi:hypothetical protein SAMN05421743_10594 [Thalassobacillus cyri]|uniref:Uncharacterized protein n=1 Tax=Thalassobacillus cyri TaxID=571932 RepID=A0A1H4BNJ8_9BACI|nr:hypothetical protein SAMN05421743_10594 [Thalassobacillus cyri]